MCDGEEEAETELKNPPDIKGQGTGTEQEGPPSKAMDWQRLDGKDTEGKGGDSPCLSLLRHHGQDQMILRCLSFPTELQRGFWIILELQAKNVLMAKSTRGHCDLENMPREGHSGP
ncbi:hypothetical protein STEG23_018715 [Scotinomys teguina]